MELKLELLEVHDKPWILLIVPYGIETNCNRAIHIKQLNLLIVPYGIETYVGVTRLDLCYAFNRTLWN